MKKIQVPIVLSNDDLLPSYSSVGSAGMDLHAAGPCIVWPHTSALVRTGICVAVPDGYELQVRPRSGLALKRMISVLNTPGTVDSDYRGVVGVILINHSDTPFYVSVGDRIAQAVLCPVARCEWVRVESLDSTDRGSGGFGSTGV